MITGAEIAFGFQYLKSALQVAKDAKDLTDSTAMRGKIIEMQDLIMQAQSGAIDAREAHAAQADRISDLEKEVARLKAWDAEKENYDLEDVGCGNVARVLKESVQTGEAAHQLCANCFADGEKSFLKRTTYAIGHDEVLSCNRCGSEMYVKGMKRPEHSGGKSPGHAGAFGRGRR